MCSADFHCCRPDSNDTEDTRVSAGSRRIHTVTKKNVCSRQNCQPRVTFDTPKPDARTTFNKDGEKHGQREILESRDIRQVPNKRLVEVQSQKSRFTGKRRVHMSCMPRNFSSIFDHSGRDTSMSFVFHTHNLTNILRKQLIQQQSVERDWLG